LAISKKVSARSSPLPVRQFDQAFVWVSLLTAAEKHHLMDPDIFLSSWSRQNVTFVERQQLQSDPRRTARLLPRQWLLQDFEPEFGPGFLYDSIMSIGLGGMLEDAGDREWNSNWASSSGGFGRLIPRRSDHVLIGTENGCSILLVEESPPLRCVECFTDVSRGYSEVSQCARVYFKLKVGAIMYAFID
jgi:hypothetical protein